MLRRDLSIGLFSSGAASLLVAPGAQAQACVQPCYPQTSAETSAGVVPVNTTYPTLDVRRYGASFTNSNGTNKAALQTAISVASHGAGGVVLVSADCHYGYVVTDSTTHPAFSGSIPINVMDYSAGNSYQGYPVAYDGMQCRYFFYTPQTTSPGMHDGNGFIIDGSWHPYFRVNNSAVINNPSTDASDNRRASIEFSNLGNVTWRVGQGTLEGAGYSQSQLSNFTIQAFNAPLGPSGQPSILIVDRSTMACSWNTDSNAVDANYHFKARVDGYYTALVESLSDPCWLVLRDATGSSNDISLKNSAGSAAINIAGQGDALIVNKTTRAITAATAFINHYAALAYGHDVVPDAGTANKFLLAVSSGAGFNLHAPGNPAVGQTITIRIINSSGGAMGVISWDPVYKLASWTNPANGFSRSISFTFDNANWVEESRTPLDVPN